MTKILMRAGKSPFEAMSSYETFDRNVMGSNNGNLLFASAAHKLLSTEGTSVDTRISGFNAKLAPSVNDEYDAFVIPLANAFRPSFENQLKSITGFIEKLTIPTVMLSGGAQSGPDGSFDWLKPMEDTVKNYCRAILKSSSHITVRGEHTASYVRSLGFNDVLVIGCPSMTMNGPGHAVRDLEKKDKYRVAYNIQTSKDFMGMLATKLESQHEATYFPQDIATLEMMLWAVEKYKSNRDARLPLRSSHDQFTQNKAEFHLDASTWINRMKDFDLSVGPRIHGNVVPILAGTPGVVLAHDSRTLELCEYHEIPHFKPDEAEDVRDLDAVIERADYSKFNAGHTGRFEKLVGFLKDNGISTIYDEGQEAARADYERRLAKTNLPEPQRTEWAGMSAHERVRLAKQRTTEAKLTTLAKENLALKKRLEKLESEAKSLVPAK